MTVDTSIVSRPERTSLDETYRGRPINFEGIIYRSPAMHRVCRAIQQTSRSNITVLIQGESGTGKELVASAIHRNSLRKHCRFLTQNAGALPDTLIESELFGHRRGSFSGAFEHKSGFFEEADGATVFLDEIGEASMALQVRLLRLLETGTFRRIGETVDRRCDVRIIAATNRDLREAVEKKCFREDLYFRLCVFPIALPPLRKRKEDIAPLVAHFIEHFSRDLGKPPVAVDPEAMAELLNRDWPGNVRELKNTVYRMLITSPPQPAPMSSSNEKAPSDAGPPSFSDEEPPVSSLKTLEEVEREHIRYVLDAVGGNQSQAARHLGLKRSTFRSRLKKLGIRPGKPESPDRPV